MLLSLTARRRSAELLMDLDGEALEKIGVGSWGHRCLLLRALAARRKDLNLSAADSGALVKP